MVSYTWDRSSAYFHRVVYLDSNCRRWLDRHLLHLGKVESLEYPARSLRPFFPGIHLDDSLRTRYRSSHLPVDGAGGCPCTSKVVSRSPIIVASCACFRCILSSDASYN